MRIDIIPDSGHPVHARDAAYGYEWWKHTCFLLKKADDYEGIENWATTAPLKNTDPEPYPNTAGSIPPVNLTYAHRIPVVHFYYLSGPEGSSLATAQEKRNIRGLTGQWVTLYVHDEEGLLYARGYISTAPTISPIDSTSFEATIIITCPDPIKYSIYEDYQLSNGASLTWKSSGDYPTYPRVTIDEAVTAVRITVNGNLFDWEGSADSFILDGVNNIPYDQAGNYLTGTIAATALQLPPDSDNIIQVSAAGAASSVVSVHNGWR